MGTNAETGPGTTVEEKHEKFETRLHFFSRIFRSFSETLDLDEVVRRVVDATFDEFHADRAWILRLDSLESDMATVMYERTTPRYPGAFQRGELVPVEPSRPLIERLLAADGPVTSDPGDPGLDPELARRYSIRSQLLQTLETPGEGIWMFGLHDCRRKRRWTEFEVSLFEEVGRYASVAIRNAALHRRAISEAAKLSAILDQMPMAAMIFDLQGKLQRWNPSAEREANLTRGIDEAGILNRSRSLDGAPLAAGQLPGARALRGESVRQQIRTTDGRSGEDRVLDVKAVPIRDEQDQVIGSVLVTTDVTEERREAELEESRRRKAECVASLGLDLLAHSLDLHDLDDVAERIAGAIEGNAFIYLYHREEDEIVLAGGYSPQPRWVEFRDYLRTHPYHPDQGLPGTVLHLQRPLLFSEVRLEAIIDFTRDETERELKSALDEQSLLAYPIESAGEPVGVLLLSLSTRERSIGPEDLDFAHDIAERIGAAHHIQQLSRTSSEGMRAAEELARREVSARARLEAVLESTPIAIAVLSADELRFELVNTRWMQFIGRIASVSPEKSLEHRYIGEFLPEFEEDLEEVAEDNTARVDEAMQMRIRGEVRFLKRIISPVRGRLSGSTQSLTVLIQDVTEQVRAKREIEALAQLMEERSARLDSILNSMTDALWVFDSSARVIDVNPAALTLFGIGSRREAIELGSDDGLVLRQSDGRPIDLDDRPLQRALRGEVIPDFVALAKHQISGKAIDLSVAAAPIRSGGIVGAVVVMRDITALLELDRKKDEFLSVASHELRTPLTTIKGYSQLLRHAHENLDSSEREAYLDAVLSEIERMMGLISELLDVSRIDRKRLELQPQETPWLSFVRSRVSAFQMQHPERTITIDSEIGERVLRFDQQRMRQVIDNLLSNAFKYSPDESPVELSIRETEEGGVQTSVIDHGIGIPADEIPKLFERFHRASNVSSRYYGGLGLGLYISRAIVRAHGGTLEVTSREGEGSAFTITLPLSAG